MNRQIIRQIWQQLGLSLGFMVLAIPNALASPLLWRIAAAPSPSNQEPLLEESFSLAQAQSRKEEADRLLEQGIGQLESGQFREAIASSERALAIYRESDIREAFPQDSQVGEGNTLANLGKAYNSLGEYERAIEFHEQALTIARGIGNRLGEGKALGNLGVTFFYLGEYERAIEFHEQALAISRESGIRKAFPQESRADEGRTLKNLGNVYNSLGEYERAIDFHEQALAIAREIGSRAEEGRTLNGLGNAYNNLSDYERAIDFYEQSLAIARDIGNRAGEGIALGNLGAIYFNLSEYERAIDFHKRALAIAREIGDRAGEGIVLGNLSTAYSSLGEYRQTIDLFEQSLTIAREIGDRASEGIVLGNLGGAYLKLSEYRQAIDLFEQSLVIARNIGNRAGESFILGNLGKTYSRLGEYRQAIDLFEQSLTIAREIGDRAGESLALLNLGNVYDSLSEYRQAIDYYEQSLAIARDIGDRLGERSTLNNLGVAYLNLSEYKRAIELFEQSLTIAGEIRDRAGESAALGNLGIPYHRLGEYRQAIEYYEQSLTIARQLGAPDREGNALNNLGLMYLLTKQPTLAEDTLTQAVDILDALRTPGLNDTNKIALFETQQNTFSLLQQAFIAQDKTEAALEIAERGRARAFAELLAQRLATKDEVVSIEPPNLEEMTAFAQQQQNTLVEYSIIPDSQEFDPVLYIWVISSDGNITFRQQPLTNIDLSTLVTTTRQTIGVRGSRNVSNPDSDSRNANAPYAIREEALAQLQAQRDRQLTQLHDLLVTPIANLLPTNPEENVIFIPQGELFLVPFPALKDPDGKYLLEKHTILTAPSIQVLQLTNNIATNHTATNRNPLIVGNPTMPTVTFLSDEGKFEDFTLSPLSGAATEARNIANFLNASPLLGDAATEATVKQQIARADSIHLATHGLLEYGDPQQTGSRDLPGAIALASGGGEDGLLTSSEILQLDLQANLVVLSACDTGRGRITGDGVIGLSRAFVAAGVPSIVVSLWSVPDAPTAELMREFYAQLDAGQPKAQALRQAMLTTIETHPDPKDWAAFTLIGES